MPKHDKRGRNRTSSPKFVQIFAGFMKEQAWRSLGMTARVLYIELKSHFNGGNNGDIGLSVRQAAANLNCSKGAAERAFKDLQAKGFIKKRTAGYLGSNGQGVSAKWELTELSYRGIRPSREFKMWKQHNQQSPVSKSRTSCHGNRDGSKACVPPKETAVPASGSGNTAKSHGAVSISETFLNIPYTPPGGRPSAAPSQGGGKNVHARIAEQLGPQGYEVLLSLSPETLDRLGQSVLAGPLTPEEISDALAESKLRE